MDFRSIGIAYANKCSISFDAPILIGYGSSVPEMDYDPWGELCRVAIVGHPDGGGPLIFGAGCPVSDKDNKWYPVCGDGGDYSFRGRKTSFIDIVYSAKT